MNSLLQDLRYGARVLLKSPGFTAIAILILALGIGANTAIFSLTDQVLLRALPVQRPEELVVLRSPGDKPGHTSSDGDDAASFSYPLYKQLRVDNTVFSGLLARFAVPLNVSGQGHSEKADGELVSGNYFEVLGVLPALGRVFSAADESAPGANPVAVLSYGYWTRHFGKSLAILNQQMRVNGVLLTVVGVARAGFAGVQIGQTPDIFIPVTMKAQMTPNWDGLQDAKDHWVAILGRVKPGVTRPQAQAALQAVYASDLRSELPLMKLTPESQSEFLRRPLLLETGEHGRPVFQQDAQGPLLLLAGMVGLVLLIACANLAGLLIARGETRQREIAVRLAIGAARTRLVRQLLTENLLLAAAGGAAGLVLASWTLGALVGAMRTSAGVLGLDNRLDGRVLGFAVGLTFFTGILFGLAPAIRATRGDLHGTLKDLGSSISRGIASLRARQGLIVAQVALTAVLLVAAGLFTRSLINLRDTNLGLRTDHVLEFSIASELNGYAPQATIGFADRLRQGIDALPGVSSASAATVPVLAGSDSGANMTFQGYTPERDEETHVYRNWIGPNYFATMGTPLLAGREFRESDKAESTKVAIINATLAQRFFAGRNPVGLHLGQGGGAKVHLDIEIVGVVQNSKHTNVRDPIRPFVYFPYAQDPTLGRITFYVRTTQDPEAMAATLRKTVQEFDPNLPIYDMETLAEQVNESVFTDRLLTFLSLCLGLLAALLAAVGLYGVMAYMVTRRTREIGIRMALGASRGQVGWLVLRELARMVTLGLVLGLAAAIAADRVLASLLFGVKAGDPLVFALAVLLLGVVALLAGAVPARKAASVDPVVALRYE